MTNTPDKSDSPMTSILITLPEDWVQQMDVLANFYCKSRMTFIRDFIHEGIKQTTDKYQSAYKELDEMNRVLTEMTEKTSKMRTERELRKSGW
jgi:metal-responsive CopG/Arc/MetJ family transcriptional regulator